MAKARGGARQMLRVRLGNRNFQRDSFRCLALCGALLACPAWAEKWDVVPTLSAAVTHTDNVSLVQDATRRSAWITQINPGISITATGARLRFNVNYAPEILYYDPHGQNETRAIQRGTADVRAEFAKKVLFVEAGAKVDEYAVSLQGPLTTSSINTTGNHAPIWTYFVSPYLVRDFGSAVRGEARFTYSVVDSDREANLPDNEADRIDLRLASGPELRFLTWDMRYTRETIKYETQAKSSAEVITGGARQLITPTVGLLGQAGYETYDSGIPGLVTKGSRWGLGLDWTPTPRTRLAATAGKRLDTNAYSLDFRHRTRLTTWSASYIEDVTTSRSELFVPATASTAGTLDQLFLPQFPDPVARQKAVEDFIARTGLPTSLSAPVNFFSDQLFLAKKLQASVALQGVRSTLIANTFRDVRESSFGGLIQVGTGEFAASDSIRQTGASLAWNWRATARQAFTLSTAYVRSEFIANNRANDPIRVDDLTSVQMSLTRQFQRSQPQLTGSIYYRWQQNDSSESASSYTENVAGATLQAKF